MTRRPAPLGLRSVAEGGSLAEPSPATQAPLKKFKRRSVPCEGAGTALAERLGAQLDPRVRDLIDFLVDAAIDRVRAARVRESVQQTGDGHESPQKEPSRP
jgi:hypothetical protein